MNRYIIWIFTGALAAMITLNPHISLTAAREALLLCGNVLIPSLLPFFICANILILTGAAVFFGRYLGFLMRPLFRVGGAGALALITGMISGYPSGAAVTCKLYEAGAIDRDEAHRLLAFVNNSGPLFIMGAVGVGIYQSPKLGVILYISHIAAALFTGMVFRFYGAKSLKGRAPCPKSAPMEHNILGRAVTDSLKSVITLCGYVVFFAVLAAALDRAGILFALSRIFAFTSENNRTLLSKGIFEIATGISAAKNADFSAVSSVLAWGGISVLFQTQSFTSKSGLSLKTYFFGKLLCGGFAALITKVILLIHPVEVEAFSAAGITKIKMFLYYLLGGMGLTIGIFALFSFISLITTKKSR